MLKKRLKPVYLLFFIIPLAYLLLWRNQPHKVPDKDKHSDYLSFSVKSTSPGKLSLVENGNDRISWNLSSNGYKNLEFVGPINSNEGITLRVDSLNINDTISFLGINLYSNNQLISFNNGLKQNITVSNARIAEKDGVIIFIVEKNGTSLNVKIKAATESGKSEPFNPKKLIIAIIFLVAFLTVFVFNPSAKYFILSLVISLFVLVFVYFEAQNSDGKIILSTSSKIKNAEIFYSRTPFFSTTKKYSSDRTDDVFSQPINFETEKFLRFDLGDSLISLKYVKIKLSSGVFIKSYDLSKLPQENLILNDLELKGDTYYVTGNDPYIKFSSKFIVNDIELLLFLQHNIFLFVCIIVFIIIICFNKFIDNKLSNIKLRFGYIAFLIIPAVYLLINQYWMQEGPVKNPDFIYFSAKTSGPAVITLSNGSDSLASWVVDAPGFKYFQHKGYFNINENFFIKITNLSGQDTISLLSINLYHNNKTYSLFEKNNDLCKISNADLISKSNEISLVVKKTGIPVLIDLLPSNLLRDNKFRNHFYALLVFLIFITFILIIIFSPKHKLFIAASVFISIFMIFFFWMSQETQSQIHLSTDSKPDRVDFFYNNTPNFQPNRSYIDNTTKALYKFQIYLSVFNYYRCDIGKNHERLKNILISAKTGILKNEFDYNTISSDNILLNDLIRIGNDYQVCGNDPFIALSSAFQVNKMQNTFLIRQNLFFLISILLFMILLIIIKKINRFNLTNLILSGFFLILIFSGLILHFFNSENIILISEKRCTNQFPKFQTDSSSVYTRELNNYILDQIPGRKNIIRMNNYLQYSVFRQLVNNQILYFGEDDWIFYIGGPAKENFENRKPLTKNELSSIKNVLEKRAIWLKERGIHFYMVFPPMSQTVYKEHIGPRMRQYYKQTKSEQLLEYLKKNSDLDIIDVYSPLMKIKNNPGLKSPYYKNNCHWNYIGGYAAYCSIIDYIKKDLPEIGEPLTAKDFNWVLTDKYKPDLLQLMDIDMFYQFQQYIPVMNYNIITDTIYPVYLDLNASAPPACVRTNRKSHPTMLMFGDSYAASIVEFLFNNFSKTYFIWTPLFHPDIIEKEKPDIVIQEMVDASIMNILLKNKPLPEHKDTADKLPD